MRHLRVMLDANVLVDAQLRDIFLLLAERELIELRWSTRLLAELSEVLVGRMHRQPEVVDRLCTAIARAFPDGEVEVNPALLAELSAPDPGDVHVLAAAVASETDVLVTHDRRGFPPDDELADWDLAVLPPAAALEELMVRLGVAVVAEVFHEATERLSKPRVDLQAQLHRLEEVAPLAGLAIGAALDLPGYRALLADAVGAQR
ncbi:MAG TPA: PIN domain-containing protein [Acidimicrobiales bacterium]|nr:PIN domain-containing protein [Acidimicrobiales bacterium]